MASDLDGDTILPLLLNRYRVEGMLGEGGLGTVVRAFDTRLKRTVAIKTLKRTTTDTDLPYYRAAEERFAREAEAGARMQMHPNLVAVHDLIVEADRTQYLILEYVPGGTLRERIGVEPLALGEALRLAAEVARGLAVAHDRGLVHRDIKPANIFLTEDDHAKVGDFGIAQIDDLSGRTHTTSTHPGTPLYMSPEQERQTVYLRPASDQYSLGLVLFEMLTGQVYKRIGARQAATLLAAQPTPVAALVQRMLAEDADDRYPDMAGVVRAAQAIERTRADAETHEGTAPARGPAPRVATCKEHTEGGALTEVPSPVDAQHAAAPRFFPRPPTGPAPTILRPMMGTPVAYGQPTWLPAARVTCPRCNADNDAEDVYCQHCGYQLCGVMQCPCGRETIPTKAVFCTVCGRSV